MAVPAIPIILQPGIRDREAGFLRYLLLVGNRTYFVVKDLTAALAEQIEVLFKVTFVTVLHGIKLQRFIFNMTVNVLGEDVTGNALPFLLLHQLFNLFFVLFQLSFLLSVFSQD